MLGVILKCLSFTSYTCLRIAITLTRSIQYMILDVCNIVEDSFQLVMRHDGRGLTSEISDDTPTLSNNITSSSAHCQTEESAAVNGFNGISRSGLLIYDLDETKIITISHNETLKHKSTFCDNCQLQIKPVIHKITTTTSANIKDNPKFNRNTKTCSSPVFSNMSIENDVSSAEIATCLQNPHRESHDSSYESSNQSSNQNVDENEYSTTFVCSGHGRDDSIINETGEFSNAMDDLCSQWTYTVTKPRVSWCESDIKCSSEKSQDFRCREYANKDFSHIFDVKSDFKSNSAEKAILNSSMKQHLSLSSNFNSTGKSLLNFKKIKNEIVEDALKSTPRHEKTNKEIKYPYSHEINVVITDDDAKEMLSYSSYESLPVSDHMRNSFENSAFYSLYKENFQSTSTPDFSCVDDFIEAFEQVKSTLSVSESVKCVVPNISQNQVRLFRTQSCDLPQRTRCVEKNKSSTKNNTTFISLDGLFESFSNSTTFNSGLNLQQTKKRECQDLEFNNFTLSPNIFTLENSILEKNPKIIIDQCNDKDNKVIDNFLNLSENESSGKLYPSVLSETNFNAHDNEEGKEARRQEKDTLCLEENIISDASSESEFFFVNSLDESCHETTLFELNTLNQNTEKQDNSQCKEMLCDSSTEINGQIYRIKSVNSEELDVEELFSFINDDISEESSSDSSALTLKEL